MLKQALLLLTTTTVILAQSTMCYKENHTSPSTIENIKLDGGECKSSKSVQDMKNDGWTISNISMNAGSSGMNYMYVFSKGTSNITSIGSMSKEELRSEFKKLAKEEEIALEKARVQEKVDLGKSIYQNTCSKCHGNNAEIIAYNKGRALNTLTSEEIKTALKDYLLDDLDYGLAIIMKPYAASLIDKEREAVANYIQTLK